MQDFFFLSRPFDIVYCVISLFDVKRATKSGASVKDSLKNSFHLTIGVVGQKLTFFVFMSTCVVERADKNKPVAASCCRTCQLALAECWRLISSIAGFSFTKDS
jgi:hypothetical protein